MAISRFAIDEYEDITLREGPDAVAYAIFLMTETRDLYTARHQRRVAEVARAIARELGLLEMNVESIYTAGILHDTGKLAVPTEILSKPSKLSQYEFGLIQSHSQAGHDILEKVGFPQSVTQAVLQHHERLNGSGYPGGLTAKDIIPEAKILAVADVVEAMASHRPYRPALGLDTALQELSTNKGRLYDTEAVEACLMLFQNDTPGFDRLMQKAEIPW